MKSMTVKILLFVFLFIIANIAWSFIASILSIRSRSDYVIVTALDKDYVIHVSSHGSWLIPLSPEGPFPSWSEVTSFTTYGSGDLVNIDGVDYQKYEIDKNVRVQYDKFTKGNILISEKVKILRVNGELSQDYKDYINHSGTYKNIDIEKPKITTFTKDMKIDSLMDSYVRLNGHFTDDGRSFDSEGILFDTWGGRCIDAKDLYEIIGVLGRPVHYEQGKPVIQIETYKKIK